MGDLWYLNQIGDLKMKEQLVSVCKDKDASESMQVFHAVKDHIVEHGSQVDGELTNENYD